MIRFISLFIALSVFSSCEKNINFNLDNTADVLVVNASIENNQPPQVVLTKSFNFFSNISPELLDSAFVHNAVISLSNGITTQQLKEYTYPLGNGYNYYVYTIDSSNLANAFIGAINTTYTLNINSQGQQYSATTTIPVFGETLDSLEWKKTPFSKDSNKITLLGKFTDPPGLGNYMRYFTKTNSGLFLPGRNSVFDDQIVDGTTYTFNIDPGIDRNSTLPADSFYFKRGDTVTVKLSSIDKATYAFWNTWEFAYQSIGNPFAQPNKVIGNVSNGALGAFCGYASAFKTIIIPK